MDILNRDVVMAHVDAMVLSPDFKAFISENHVEALRRLYSILKRVDFQA
jgi:hypothetical protein